MPNNFLYFIYQFAMRGACVFHSVYSQDDSISPASQMPKGLPEGIPTPDWQTMMSAADKPTLYLGSFQILKIPLGASGIPSGLPGGGTFPGAPTSIPTIKTK